MSCVDGGCEEPRVTALASEQRAVHRSLPPHRRSACDCGLTGPSAGPRNSRNRSGPDSLHLLIGSNSFFSKMLSVTASYLGQVRSVQRLFLEMSDSVSVLGKSRRSSK